MKIEIFWKNLTVTQRAILTTAMEMKFNSDIFLLELASGRAERVVESTEGNLGQLTENIHKRIRDWLMHDTDISFETALKKLLCSDSL